MPALRTSLVALAVGGAAVTTGVVATNAAAAPAPVAAVTTAAPVATPAAGTSGSSADGSALRGRVHSWWSGLTDAQRQCLEDADLRRPVGPMDDAERATLRSQVQAAADGCEVELPFARARAFWDGLSDTQRQCLQDADVTRPLGRLTPQERRQVRQDLRDAAQQCGITLPSAPATPGASGSALVL